VTGAPRPHMKKPRLGRTGAWVFEVDGTCTADHEAIRYLESSTTIGLRCDLRATSQRKGRRPKPTPAAAASSGTKIELNRGWGAGDTRGIDTIAAPKRRSRAPIGKLKSGSRRQRAPALGDVIGLKGGAFFSCTLLTQAKRLPGGILADSSVSFFALAFSHCGSATVARPATWS
jgi:hypothetical protein